MSDQDMYLTRRWLEERIRERYGPNGVWSFGPWAYLCTVAWDDGDEGDMDAAVEAFFSMTDERADGAKTWCHVSAVVLRYGRVIAWVDTSV